MAGNGSWALVAVPEAERGQVAAALATARAFNALAVAVLGAILLPEAVMLWRRRRAVSLRTPALRVSLWMFLVTLLCLAGVAMMGSLVWAGWTGSAQACAAMGKLISQLYIFAKVAAYLFMYDRAKIVHEALHYNSRALVAARWGIYLVIFPGVPLLFSWVVDIIFTGHVLEPEGNCVYVAGPGYSTALVATGIAFAVGDAALNVALLGLFVLPLNGHMRRLGGLMPEPSARTSAWAANGSAQQRQAASMRRLVIWNIAGSLAVTTVTIAAMTLLIAVLVVAGNTPYPDAVDMWALLPPNADLLLTGVVVHVIDVAWLPPAARRALRGLVSARFNLRLDRNN